MLVTVGLQMKVLFVEHWHVFLDKICLVDSSIDVLHIPERVEGPFLRSPVEKVYTLLFLRQICYRAILLHSDSEINLKGVTLTYALFPSRDMAFLT